MKIEEFEVLSKEEQIEILIEDHKKLERIIESLTHLTEMSAGYGYWICSEVEKAHMTCKTRKSLKRRLEWVLDDDDLTMAEAALIGNIRLASKSLRDIV